MSGEEQGGSRLANVLRRVNGRLRRNTSVGGGVSERPGTAFEMVTRRGLDDLARDVERLELKVNGMLLAVFGSLLIEFYRALAR